MTLWQPIFTRPERKLRRWQRKTRVAAWRASRGGHVRAILTWRIWSALLVALVVLIGLLANSTARHWISTSFANVVIIGGILAAPLISLVAWIGVILPVRAPLHQAAPTLFIGALLWMAMGIVSAHTRRHETADRQG